MWDWQQRPIFFAKFKQSNSYLVKQDANLSVATDAGKQKKCFQKVQNFDLTMIQNLVIFKLCNELQVSSSHLHIKQTNKKRKLNNNSLFHAMINCIFQPWRKGYKLLIKSEEEDETRLITFLFTHKVGNVRISPNGKASILASTLKVHFDSSKNASINYAASNLHCNRRW